MAFTIQFMCCAPSGILVLGILVLGFFLAQVLG